MYALDEEPLPLESGYLILPEPSPVSPQTVFLPPNHPQNLTGQGLLVFASTAETLGEPISMDVDPRFVAAGKVLSEAAHMELHYDESGNVDYRTTLEEEMGDVLLICAKTAGVNGVCGVSYGITAAGPIGGRGSLDFVVDSSGNMAVYATGGAGAYATPLIATVNTGPSVFVAPNATVDDAQGWAVQFGGSVTLGGGVGGEWVIFKNEDRVFHGLVVSTYGGSSFEIHGSATYSYQLYRSQ